MQGKSSSGAKPVDVSQYHDNHTDFTNTRKKSVKKHALKHTNLHKLQLVNVLYVVKSFHLVVIKVVNLRQQATSLVMFSLLKPFDNHKIYKKTLQLRLQ